MSESIDVQVERKKNYLEETKKHCEYLQNLVKQLETEYEDLQKKKKNVSEKTVGFLIHRAFKKTHPYTIVADYENQSVSDKGAWDVMAKIFLDYVYQMRGLHIENIAKGLGEYFEASERGIYYKKGTVREDYSITTLRQIAATAVAEFIVSLKKYGDYNEEK